ncbi:helix-turn-helix domain-containing protein [Planomonospora alba]|uniref:helix-turn-helix domain-containing protein n=1 Tax=Planomonospora alba TaxID=161354 RepID=UPI0031E95133
MDSRVATAELRDLVARELVLQTGTRRWARYELPQRLRDRTSAGAPASTRADRRPQLLGALGDETLSRAELARRTGLTDQTVRRWLSIMREEGTVELVGSSPRSSTARYRQTRQGAVFPSAGPQR